MLTGRTFPSLWIGLLGPPEVKWDDATLPLARRQTRALLYRLAAQLTPVPRTQLAFLFWPDFPDTAARRNLTHLLTLLRQALAHPDLLLTDVETVALHPQRVQSDTDTFARLASTPDAQARLDALIGAMELYRGPFLDGFALPDCPEFEIWLDQERRAWERRYDDTLATVVEAQTVQGDYAAAIATARRALARDDLAEELHRRLIALYAAVGDRAAALRQFEECAKALDRELEVAPLPETRAVYEAVRDGTPLLPPRAAITLAVSEMGPAADALPMPPTPLIGRATMLAEVSALLRTEELRLLTLAGPGGTGKTRLALEVVRMVVETFADGAVFVPLAPLRDPTEVLRSIAATLGLGERDNRPLLIRLRDALQARKLLLVLDNFEHLLEAAPDIADLLAVAPRLKLLVTSRALLRIAGEQVYLVSPLDLPELTRLPGIDELAQISAVALFLIRVRERLPTFRMSESNASYIAAICARLDGLPLAIELAAARAAMLSPRMLLARLDRRLTLLTEGPRDLPPRQRTLRATIDWSYDLLDVGEQLLLGRLGSLPAAGRWKLSSRSPQPSGR